MAPRRNSNPKGNPKKNKKRSRLEKRARRNVNISYQPGINSINRQIDQQNLDFQNQDLGIQSIYGDRSELKALTPQYEKISGDIVQDLQGQQAELLGALNQQGLPTSELSANTAVLGQQNMNNYNTLASNRDRGVGYNQSALREHELSERYSRQNLQQQYSDNLQMLYNRMADIQDQKQPAILAELDRLREDARARRQEQAYADLIADLTGNALDEPRRRGPGPGPNRRNSGPGNNVNPPGPNNTVSYNAIDNSGRDWGQQVNLPGSLNARIQNINQMDNFRDIPSWLQWIYSAFEGPGRWEAMEGMPNERNRRRIFRRTRDNVGDLWRDYQ